MFRSKATVTEEESNEILRLYHEARSTPVMLVGGVDASSHVWKAFHDHLDKLAKQYGLVYQPGEWGFDPETRQFLSEFAIEQEETKDGGA